MTILIVDDDPVARRLYTLTLERAKHQVASVPNAEAAIEWLKNDASATLIIMDTELPGRMKGLAFFSLLKSKAQYRKIPVIVASGQATKEDVDAAIARGVQHFLVKPVRHQLLVEKVNSLLSEVAPVLEPKFDAMARLGVSEQEYGWLAGDAMNRMHELVAQLAEAKAGGDVVGAINLLPRFKSPAALLGAARLLDAVNAFLDGNDLNQQQRDAALEAVQTEAQILEETLQQMTRLRA